MLKVILMFFMSISCNAKEIRIAVIDTGFDFTKKDQIKLCDTGHVNFSYSTIQEDEHGHGTNVAGLIARYAKNNYCIIVIKALGPLALTDGYSKAMKYINNLDYDILNISAAGANELFNERLYLDIALNRGKKVVVAAGNNSVYLKKGCRVFPACIDDRIIVVGNNDASSNFGPIVDIKENGNNQTALGIQLSGSSQSTAIITGKIANKMANK